jgi:hypothetical protein
MTADFSPSFEVTRLYEKTSQRGTRYFVGRLGGARVTLLPGDPAEDGTPVWRMLLQEASKTQASTDRLASKAPRRRSRRPEPVLEPAGPPLHDDPLSDLWSDAP